MLPMRCRIARRAIEEMIRRLCLTMDKREIKDFPKLPSATSFIHIPLSEMLKAVHIKITIGGNEYGV